MAKVYFTLRAVDVIDGAAPVVSKPESGDTFYLGATTVKCTAINSRGVTAADSFVVIVKISAVGPMAGAVAVSVLTQGIRIAVQTGMAGGAEEKKAIYRAQLAKTATLPLWAGAEAVSAKPAVSNQRILIDAPRASGVSDTGDGASFEGILTAPTTGFYKIWLRGAPGAALWLSDSEKPTDNHVVLEITDVALQTFLGIEMRKGEKRYIRAFASKNPAGFSVELVGSGILPERLPGKYVTPASSQ